MSPASAARPDAPHIPVLIDPLIETCAPVTGTWVDGTFGAGGYTRRLLDAGADHVIAIDRDPLAFELAGWAQDDPRITLVPATFSTLDDHAADVDGVVLDLGVSSMQIDRPERGFSFMSDGPLDMRMSQQGTSAADLVNGLDEAQLADVLYHYGEERASRRLARAIVKARPLTRTSELAEILQANLPRPKPGQSHPATRSFQALRIAVNNEYGELLAGLHAAERALKPGGLLAVVTFHSVEDRMVKRFFQLKSGKGQANRYAPATEADPAQWQILTRKAIAPDRAETEMNPRARSAKLRVARRTATPASDIDARSVGMPVIKGDLT